jgi:hypothetical protein
MPRSSEAFNLQQHQHLIGINTTDALLEFVFGSRRHKYAVQLPILSRSFLFPVAHKTEDEGVDFFR